MKPKTRALAMFALCGFFLFIDRALKYFALSDLNNGLMGQEKFLRWYPFQNSGIAFGLPLPLPAILAFSLPVIILIAYAGYRAKDAAASFPLMVILTGAVSNLFDRIYYGFTIDYWYFFTAIINISDIAITAGFILYIFALEIKTKK